MPDKNVEGSSRGVVRILLDFQERALDFVLADFADILDEVEDILHNTLRECGRAVFVTVKLEVRFIRQVPGELRDLPPIPLQIPFTANVSKRNY